MQAKDWMILRDEREGVDRLADAINEALCDVFDDPDGMNGGDPFEPEDKVRIARAAILGLRRACERLGYGRAVELGDDHERTARRIMDKKHASDERSAALH